MSTINNIRLIINIPQFNKSYEVYFSLHLSLSENIKLLLELVEIELNDYLVIPYNSSSILDPNKKLSSLNFIAGQVLYLYSFTKY